RRVVEKKISIKKGQLFRIDLKKGGRWGSNQRKHRF
ncbi:MAG: hypothetical protein ACI837_000241, partial [Crocinitomicaceae bacterium]